MMRALLGSCRTGGEAVAYLWASEETIYGRFGFGLASFTAEIDLPRERSAFHARFAASGNVRLAPLATTEEYVAPVYERVASVTPGMFARSSPWWQDRTLADPEWLRGGRGELQCAVLEHEERATGYALYRMNWAFERGLQAGSVAVVEAVGESPEATAAIWRYLLAPTGWHASKPGFCRSIIRCCCWRRSRAGSASAFVTASGYGCSTRRWRCRRGHIRIEVLWSSR
jgi:predicted acetyltransferase